MRTMATTSIVPVIILQRFEGVLVPIAIDNRFGFVSCHNEGVIVKVSVLESGCNGRQWA